MSTWESLGVPAATIKQITTYMAGNTMNCSRDERSAPPYSCEVTAFYHIGCRRFSLLGGRQGLSDIGCQFSDFNSVIFNKTDGAVASPPNHKVIAENDQVPSSISRPQARACIPCSLWNAMHDGHPRLAARTCALW